MAVFAGLAANTLLGAWWLDGVVALAAGKARTGRALDNPVLVPMAGSP